MNIQPWANEVIEAYASHSSNQFILHGNTQDRMVIPHNGSPRLGSLDDYIMSVILPKFDIVHSYDLGNGIVAVKDTVPPMPLKTAEGENVRHPRVAIETMTKFFRQLVAYRAINKEAPSKKVAFIIKGANLVIPNPPAGQTNYDLSAMATLIRAWTIETGILSQDIAVFLIADSLNDLHPLVVNNNRATKVLIPFPTANEIDEMLQSQVGTFKDAIGGLIAPNDFLTYTKSERLSSRLVGMKMGTIEGMLQVKQHRKEPLKDEDLVKLRKDLIERDANGLITFMQPERTLQDFTQNPAIRDYLLTDVDLWRKGKFDAMPMGYGIFAPVGCGKGFLVECMAGSYGVPFLTIGQFRDKYLGVAESNVERIFRFIDAAAPCVVFIDEMDQAMGKRNVEGDSGVGGRIYSMFATKMSDPRNRGKIIWCGATSRPDQIEVDLTRPGRLDVKMPILPAASNEDAFNLFKTVLRRFKTDRGAIEIPNGANVDALKGMMPPLLTAGAANALASKVCRVMLTRDESVEDAIKNALTGYQNPVPLATMEFQIKLAINATSDLSFVPQFFRERYAAV